MKIKNLLIICSVLFFSSAISQKLTESASIPEVVISSNKTETSKKMVVQTIETIDQKSIFYQSPSTPVDLLQSIGKVFVQQSQNGGGSPTIRGFEANRILITVDGVRMNTAIFRSGHLQNVMRIDPSQLHNLEILYGAGSTLFGSDAMGGVLNFSTRKVKLNSSGQSFKISGDAFGRLSTANDEKTAGFSINAASNKFGSLTSFSFSDFGDLRMGNIRDPKYGNWGKRMYFQGRQNDQDIMIPNPDPNIQIGTSYSQYNILQKFLYKPNPTVSHLINFQYSNSSDVPRYDRLTEKRNNGIIDADPVTNPFTSAQWFYGPEARLMASYQLQIERITHFSDLVTIIAAYQNYKESRNNRNFNSNWLRSQRENVDIASINIDAHKSLMNHKLSYGLEAIHNWVGSSVIRYHILTGATRYAPTRYPDGGSQTFNLAAYFRDIVSLIPDRLYLNVGARLGHYSVSGTVNDSTRKYRSFTLSNLAYSFDAGLKYHPTPDHSLSVNVSSAYRSPNLDDVSKIFEVDTFIQVNSPDITPERAINFEINSFNRISKHLSLEVGTYYTLISDYIANQYTTQNGKSYEIIDNTRFWYQKLGNENQAKIMGIYSTISARINQHIALNASLNYTRGLLLKHSNPNHTPLDHIPPMTLHAAMPITFGQWRIEPFVLANSAKNPATYNLDGEDNQNKSADPIRGLTPAWITYNVRASAQFHRSLTLQAALENILDSHYRTFASGISAPGRNLRLTLRTQF